MENTVHSLGGVQDVQLSVLLRKMEYSHTSASCAGEIGRTTWRGRCSPCRVCDAASICTDSESITSDTRQPHYPLQSHLDAKYKYASTSCTTGLHTTFCLLHSVRSN